jgi:hypothetical protein
MLLAISLQSTAQFSRHGDSTTHLVTVSPEEVLGADVLEWVLGLLLKRRAVGNVLPVLVPQTPCVDAGEDERRDNDAVGVISCCSFGAVMARVVRGVRHTRWKACARGLRSHRVSKDSFSTILTAARTRGRSGVVLHGLALAVEGVVLGAGGLETALGYAAERGQRGAGDTDWKHGDGFDRGVGGGEM